uniref:Uncharacterized protein n=1 Tax=viral metagenome TaxID=1070528 RepID=A0A6C0L6H5_9ZZZZ
MFIGVCFFGRSKYYDKKYLLESFGPNHTYDIFYSADNEPEETIADFIKVYSPISINNDKITYDVDFGIYPNNRTCLANINNMTRHLINKKRVFALLEEHCIATGKVYDLIVSCRLDLHMDKYAPELPLANTVYIPSGYDYEGINDRFAMGDFQTMKQYMNIYDNCLYLLTNKISVPHPESLHLDNIRHCKVNIERFNLHQSITL